MILEKHLLEFDDISNEQRKVIYNQRDEILSSDNMDEIFNNILEYTCDDILLNHLPEDLPSSQWDLDQIDSVLKK